jgi:hypothetical protein
MFKNLTSFFFLQALSKARDVGNALAKNAQVKQPNQPLLDKSIDSLLEKFNALQTDRLKTKPRWAKTWEDQDQKGKPPG